MTEEKELIQRIIEGIQEKKGKNIVHIDLTKFESATTRNFIICNGNSTNQVSAIADSVEDYVREHTSMKPYNCDGYANAHGIVLDYGTVYVHIFLPEFRDYYRLEELWNDAPINIIPDLD